MSETWDTEILDGFFEEALEDLTSLDVALVELRADPSRSDVVHQAFRTVHSIKGNAGFFGFIELNQFCDRFENLLSLLRENVEKLDDELLSVMFAGFDLVRVLLDRTREDGAGSGLSDEELSFLDEATEKFVFEEDEVGVPTRLLQHILDSFERPSLQELVLEDQQLGQILDQVTRLLCATESETAVRESEVPGPEAAAAEPSDEDASAPRGEVGKKSTSQRASIRVGQERIDEFLVHVGEMLMSSKSYSVLENRLSELGQRDPAFDEILQDLKLTNRRLNEVSYKLQGKVLALRKQPARQLLSSAPRMVVELARKLGKDVAVEIEGEEIEVDRSTLDLLKDPMTHMLRNSLDHGLEGPEEREAAGKNAQGKIVLRARATKKHFVLEIEDDGRGIDTERVARKAVESGAIREAEIAAMDERDLQRLIFHPGLSTAEVRTDVSGRGVGMDSVLSNVGQAGGRVDVESEQGVGTKVLIEIPLAGTLMVIPALMVEVAGADYYIPIDSIREVLERGDRNVKRLPNGSEVVEFRNRVRPFVRTGEFVPTHEETRRDGERPYWLLVAKGGAQCCLEIDRLRGIEQIIVLDIHEQFPELQAVQGAALTGDGRVALVMDVQRFLEGAHETVGTGG